MEEEKSKTFFFTKPGTFPRLIIVAVILVAGIFVLDLSLPLGVAAGVPYVLPVLLALWMPRRYVIYFALAGTALTGLGFYLSPPSGEMWKVVFNRFLALFAIWVTAVLCLLLRKRTDEVLRASTSFLSTVVDNVLAGIITINEKGIVESMNPAAEHIFGYASSEVINRNIKMLMPEPYHSEHDGYIRNYLQTGKPQIIGMVRELEGLRQNRATFPLELAVSEMRLGSQRYFLGIVQDITERKQAQGELEQFAYVVSHDLKAPLRGIINLSQWIEEDLGDKVEGETADDLVLLRKRVHRMEALINGILEYSRVGQTKSNNERVDVKDVLDEVMDSLTVPDGFSVEVKPQMPTLMADRTKIMQVFANLISNAIKHNKGTQGRVEIAAHDADAFCRFTVKDNGPGIAPEYHEKIFTIFQTLESRDNTENTGVGLAIVKKMVESAGGNISVDSIEGQGATFIFLWPKASKQD